ncbi:MAG: hypothetical protein IPM54_44000 [Polyangiaceae bacterium]|nr:hypothetical protein [Polyangiaceae bacterium]
MAKLGQMAIDSLGYEKIMTRAEDMGWVETVAVEQALSVADKRFIADGPPPSSAVVEAAFKRVMTRAAPAALLASQADSPAPGPGDLVALGILAAGLVAVGGITVYELVTAPPAAATTAAPAPAPAAQPNATPPPPPPPQKQPACPQNERFIPEHTDDARGCYTKKGNLQCYATRHYPCAGVHTHGRVTYQQMRGSRCVEIDKEAVRCEGSFQITGRCGSVSTTTCGDGGPHTSGIHVKGKK